jgi:hypothetical protein
MPPLGGTGDSYVIGDWGLRTRGNSSSKEAVALAYADSAESQASLLVTVRQRGSGRTGHGVRSFGGHANGLPKKVSLHGYSVAGSPAGLSLGGQEQLPALRATSLDTAKQFDPERTEYDGGVSVSEPVASQDGAIASPDARGSPHVDDRLEGRTRAERHLFESRDASGGRGRRWSRVGS